MATAFLGKQTSQHSPKSLINNIYKYKKINNNNIMIIKRKYHTISKQDMRNPEDIFNELGIKVEN